MDVPYRTLWVWINESDENQQRYDEAKEEQDEMIRMKFDEFIDSMRQGDIQVETEDCKEWVDSFENQGQKLLKKQCSKTLFWSM